MYSCTNDYAMRGTRETVTQAYRNEANLPKSLREMILNNNRNLTMQLFSF